jgi:hypothetical protein
MAFVVAIAGMIFPAISRVRGLGKGEGGGGTFNVEFGCCGDGEDVAA